ncbi:Sorting nexin-2 [Eufriesea mexicana]|uniref:Sorting nexin-2 n=1 Tax=Eufriesea mexicana TaxID=516756 RepID=A0A310SLK6_9HYME|nr:Sorting nexin-2 [Eufriesea mexicana]
MADIKESPPLFDTNETKVDDLDDDDEDIFASAVQDQSQLEDSSPHNGVSSIQAELPKLTLRDAPEENSFSSVSSPAPGPLSSPLGPMSTDIGDLHDVPINDNTDVLSPSVMQTQSSDVVSTDFSDVFLKITVTSPQKIGDGMGAYVAYKVETKTNMPIFRKRNFSVIRRFSDFLGLHDKLTDKYLRNGRIIPPAPEKTTCTGATARSIAVLGHGEPGASLGRALAQLAETLEKVEVIRRAQSNSDLYQFGEMLRDYVALIGAIKDVFHERVKVFQNWQHAQMMLNKKREQKARLEQSGRTDKTSQAATEVIEWEAKVERGQEEFDNISKMIKKEVERFELVRVEDFKKQLTEYLESMLQYQNQLIKYWESFLPEARAVA